MLAAMPSDTMRRLELFFLALALRKRPNSQMPPSLASHFESVLEQARQLLDDKGLDSAEMLPQAVQLANELRCYSDLRDALANVRSIRDVSPEIANLALQSMRPNLASPH